MIEEFLLVRFGSISGENWLNLSWNSERVLVSFWLVSGWFIIGFRATLGHVLNIEISTNICWIDEAFLILYGTYGVDSRTAFAFIIMSLLDCGWIFWLASRSIAIHFRSVKTQLVSFPEMEDDSTGATHFWATSGAVLVDLWPIFGWFIWHLKLELWSIFGRFFVRISMESLLIDEEFQISVAKIWNLVENLAFLPLAEAV